LARFEAVLCRDGVNFFKMPESSLVYWQICFFSFMKVEVKAFPTGFDISEGLDISEGMLQLDAAAFLAA